MIYSEYNIKEYRSLPQTGKMLCKKAVARLLKINGYERTSAAIGQWFIEPNKITDFEKLSKDTILYLMRMSITLTKQQLTHQKQSNFFTNFFKF